MPRPHRVSISLVPRRLTPASPVVPETKALPMPKVGRTPVPPVEVKVQEIPVPVRPPVVEQAYRPAAVLDPDPQPAIITDREAGPLHDGLASPPVIMARPLYRKNPPPRYPDRARRHGLHGTALLEVLVTRQGRVGDARLFESSGHGLLDRAALQAVRDWLFEPGRQGNEVVEMWVRVPVRFQLQ